MLIRKVSLSYRSWMKSLYIRNSAAVTASPSGIRDRSNLNSRWCRRTGRNSLSCSTAKHKHKKNHEKCIFKEAVCIQRMFPIHMSYVAFSPLAVILNFYRQTQRANVTFLWNLKAFRVVLSCIFQGNKTCACKVGRQQMSFTLRLSTIHFS